jgi:hypothetical protein
VTAPNHENPSEHELRAQQAAERQAMLHRLADLRTYLQGMNGHNRVHAEVAIEALRARLLGLVR